MSDPLGHVIRTAHNQRASESFNRFFRRQQVKDEEQHVSADGGAHSSPPPQPLDGNAILREVFEEAVGAKQMRRRWG
jgi:hypothetical protein